MELKINDLGKMVADKRGTRGVRAAALEAGVSPATLSRVENGHMPDLATFARLCKWVERDPREFLGMELSNDQATTPTAVVHFKKKKTVAMDTATALGHLIIAAQNALRARESLLGK
ncbi:MAG TPA: helix-turn-helix transcriptional regulator [Rhodanobacteraceae bacterium]|nr:helix-turn-helix transcriptional regulator [Rhodanobacteraceae bacterium]